VKRRSILPVSALGVLPLLAAATACGPTLLPVADPSGNGELVYDLELGLPRQLDPAPLRTAPYAPGLRLYLEAVEDARDDRTRLGELTGGATPIPVLGSGMPPPVFVGQVFAKEIAASGIVLIDHEEGANRAIRMRLVRFFTEEHNMYHAEVRATVEVLDPSKQVLATVLAMGSSRVFGRSLSVEDFREVFGEATLDMASNVLDNGRIQAALDVRPDGGSAPRALRAAEGGAL